MKFESKAHMAQELMAGKRFAHRGNPHDVIYYDEREVNPFRFGHIKMMTVWDAWMDDVWEEVKHRHVHQDLIDSYQEGQAWQAYNKSNGEWYNLRKSNTWLQPVWDANTEYRLHPHNEVIQAHRNGATIQCLDAEFTNWQTIDSHAYIWWLEHIQYRVKPNTKTVYEWMYNAKYSKKWIIELMLMTEEEASNFYTNTDFEYKKTGRSFEVEV